MESPGYGGVRERAKTSSMNVVEFLEKLNVSRLRAFWWSRLFSLLSLCSRELTNELKR